MLHLLDGSDQEVVPTETVQRAGYLIRDFLLPQARDFFAEAAGSPFRKVVEVAGWILTRTAMRFLASDVTAGVRSCRGIGSKELGELLDPLIIGGWIRPETNFPNNRAWIVHAKLRETFAQRVQSERERRDEVHAMLSSLGGKS